MLSKNNRKLQERKLQEKQRFGFRKYSFGLASALLGVSFMLGTGSTVSAATTTPSETVAAATTSNTDSGAGAADTAKLEATDTKSTDAAASTTDTSATETKADTNAAEASNTASDSSATTDANSTSAATDNSDTKAENTTASDTAKTASTEPASGESKNATTDASAEKATDSAAQATNALKAAAVATDASATTTDADSTITATDDAASAKGKITDEGKSKGLTDSDVDPEMSDANGASLVADDSNIPSGYKADPTEGRYTFGIVSLGGDFDKWVKGDASKFKSYNGENNTHYYLRFSTSKNATNGTYDSTVYSQVVDATTDTVKWEQALTPNSGAVKVNNGTDGFELSSKVAGVTQYYELKYTDTKIGNASTSRITINPNNGSLTAVTVYSNGKAIPAGSATPGTYTSVLFPATGVIKTEYIAQDAAGNETTLATYEEGGRQGYTYTISDSRVIKGYDLISSPSTTTGILGKTYNVGDVYAGGNLELSDQLQLARVYVATSEYGDAKVEVRVALKKDADGNAITISSLNDANIWKTILSTDSLAPGATASDGNYGNGASYYINGTDGIKYITDAGFTEEQLAGYKSHLAVIILANGLTQGQEPAKYYYAPQGQVRINYVTSDGKEIRGKDPVSAYENSGANTSYDVTGSTYQPQTITADGKTYRFVKSDKSMGTAGTTEINGYTYNVTPSDATGTIKSTTVNDVYYVYEQVTYHTEAESKDVTRTIEYYDSVTGEPIPSNLESTVTQTATLTRNKIYDDQNNFIGYGTVSADGSSYTIDDSWKVDAQTWTQQDSADLSDYGYTAPDRASVAAVTVDGDTTNVTEKVYYGHQTVLVTPENPGTPGEPINPNDPNSPVYGEETDRKNLVKDASQTIHYVGAGDDTPADNVVTQKDAFTRTVTIDKVTGKVLSYTDWTGEKTFNTVDTPVVQGYHADKKTAGGLTATVDNPDVEETVTYAPNGKLVPVDPDGNPIPGADTPTYPTDPNDPTKVVPNEPIPDVPGYTPVDPSPVTPTNPGEDTPVPYTKDETPAAKYGLTEKFVDEDGNELSPSVNKGTDYKTGDKYDVTKDAKVITGYVLVKTTDVTGTFTDSDKTAVFTYKKIGKIVPVDPKGNPIPGADTPTYKNDPDDPSKVVPNEPTPDVPGYKTDVPNVTPEDPTKDTPVPYTQDGKGETPSTPEGPTTPSNPEVPTSPEEPSTPDTPEVPSQPQEPASPSGQKPSQPAKPASPSGQKPSQPAKPATPKQTTFTPNSGKKTPAQGKTATASQLPQTGADEEKASLLSAVGLGAIALASLFGLLGGKKRKH